MAEHWESLTDEVLLLRIQEGSHFAFSVLVKRHTDRFYRLAYRFVGSREEAEDVVQEALIKLWEHPHSWQPEKQTKFTTWFYRVIVNRCLDRQRKNISLSLPEDAPIADKRASQEAILIHRQQRSQLEQALADLPERQRAALHLCFSEGLSNQEAADVLGIHLKALQSLIMRAKATLKDSMQEKRRRV